MNLCADLLSEYEIKEQMEKNGVPRSGYGAQRIFCGDLLPEQERGEQRIIFLHFDNCRGLVYFLR